MKNNEILLDSIKEEINKLEVKLEEMKKYDDENLEKIKKEAKLTQLVRDILVYVRCSSLILGVFVKPEIVLLVLMGTAFLEIATAETKIYKQNKFKKIKELNTKNKTTKTNTQNKLYLYKIILKYCQGNQLNEEEIYKLSENIEQYTEFNELSNDIKLDYPQFEINKNDIERKNLDNRISFREIVVDINNMKDNKMKLVEYMSQEQIDELLNRKFKYMIIGSLSPFIGIAVALFLVIVGVNFVVWPMYTALYILQGALFMKGSKINSKINESIKLKESALCGIEDFIENHEIMLESRKGKDIKIENSKINNLNVCFGLDHRYAYDLKKIHANLQMKPNVDTSDKNIYIPLGDFYKEIEEGLPELELIKSDSKVRILKK